MINAQMDSIDSVLAMRIRADIIHGAYEEGERLSEARLCETHSVSRTPVRLALRLLEREGVVRRGEGRGYMVQSPTVADILQAVQVRGHLESLAARLMAQSDQRSEYLPDMARGIEIIDAFTRKGKLDDDSIREAQSGNKLFHTAILAGCGNDYIGYTCEQISHLPMLAVGSMVFDRAASDSDEQTERAIFRLKIGNAQHQVIYEAIENSDPVRAEAMVAEHSHTMLEYIQKFEKREDSLTVADLVAYSGYETKLI